MVDFTDEQKAKLAELLAERGIDRGVDDDGRPRFYTQAVAVGFGEGIDLELVLGSFPGPVGAERFRIKPDGTLRG